MIQRSRLDKIYRRMLITRFFEKGWGKPDNLQRLFEFRKFVSNRDTCYNLVPHDYPVQITRHDKKSDYHIIEGRFTTPMELYLPGLVPKESLEAHFQVILPLKWKDDNQKPICLHLAGTGDHFYWRRRNFLAKPLIREGNIGAILLENPFYGQRKPHEQVRSNLQNVSDIFVMGGCLILESLVLFHWCERNGLGPLGISGLSMGGHMASLAATNWPKPLVLVPCLSWSTASAVFTEGVMSQSINWDTLESQYLSNGIYRDHLSKMVSVVDDSFLAGQKFVKQYKQSMIDLKDDIKDTVTKGASVTKDEIAIDSMLQDAQSDELSQNKCDNSSVVNNASSQTATPSSTTSSTVYSTLLDAGNAITSVISDSSTKLMDLILPATKTKAEIESKPELPFKNGKHGRNDYFGPIDTTIMNWWERDALQFMRGVMDECTHLKNFSVPYDTSLITSVCAKEDAYIPREGCSSIEEVWPGAEVKYLDAGHVSAYVLYQKLFRSVIIEAFEKAKEKHNPELHRRVPTITLQQLQQEYLTRLQSRMNSTQREHPSCNDLRSKSA